jgi:hypothetical protein
LAFVFCKKKFTLLKNFEFFGCKLSDIKIKKMVNFLKIHKFKNHHISIHGRAGGGGGVVQVDNKKYI